jgi:predicted MFS family arabinose efflux permease
MLENRALASWTLLGTAVALVGAALAPAFAVFLIASVVVGLTSVVVQVIVPMAAHLAPEGQAGRIVGTVMMGLLLGIMLARTLASFAAAAWGWHAIFLISAGVMVVLSFLLRAVLPRRTPVDPPRYPELMASIARLVRTESTLRRRALTQALLFGAFTAFWTAVAFELISRFGFSQTAIGLFALVGAAGAFAAPVAGWVGDKGWGHLGSGGALALAIAALVIAAFGSASVILLAIGAIMLDFAVQSHQVLSQHEIYALSSAARGRINTVFMSTVFVGGAISSAVTGLLYDAVGWSGVALFAAALPAVGLCLWLIHNARMRGTGRARGNIAPDR